jgi:hypothetical protein
MGCLNIASPGRYGYEDNCDICDLFIHKGNLMVSRLLKYLFGKSTDAPEGQAGYLQPIDPDRAADRLRVDLRGSEDGHSNVPTPDAIYPSAAENDIVLFFEEEARLAANKVSTNMIKTLQERKWVKPLGHKYVPGRPTLYGTTKTFLDYFNLRSLNQLPTLAGIRDLEQYHPELALESSDVVAQ